MLDTITITCPKCHQSTQLAVASPGATELTGSASACRACRAQLLTFTRPDGQILIIDGASKGAPEVLLVISPVSRSGYRIVPPKHLGIFDRGIPYRKEPPTGVSDADLEKQVTSGANLLYRPDGSPRAPRDAARILGWRAVWVAQLYEALQHRLQGPPPLSHPPAVFISYRWGTPAENDWTAELARRIAARGYPVIFDREKPAELDVPEMVSQIADSRYFLAVLDPGYVERLGTGGSEEPTKDGWVFDEYNTAASLSNQGQLRILGLLRKGDRLPGGFRQPEPGRPGNVVDVRTEAQLALVLDEAFPPIEDAPDAATAARARVLLLESHDELCAGRFQEAFDKAQELAQLIPAAVDGLAQQVRVALRAGAAEVGWDAAEAALRLAPDSLELKLAAGSFAGDIGRHREAVVHLATLLQAPGDDPSLDLAAAHMALGSALDELDQVYPALAHLERARTLRPESPNIRNTLGFVYRRAGEPDLAITCLHEGLKLAPDSAQLLENLAAAQIEAGRTSAVPRSLVKQYRRPVSPVWVTCTNCAARIPLSGPGDNLCVRCGSAYPVQEAGCPSCEFDGRIAPAAPGLAFECPYCREGRLGLAASKRPKLPRSRVKHAKGG